MAGMALQCLKNEETAVKDTAELDRALASIKQRLLDSKRADGHMGNEFSTGLAVQVRIMILNICFNEKALFEWQVLRLTGLVGYGQSDGGMCLCFGGFKGRC